MLRRQMMAASALAGLSLSTGVAKAQEPVTVIQELVVTAEKRAQSLQDVPAAVTAFSGETREKLGVNSVQDLTNFTPGLNYNTGNDRMTMRGIGRLTNNRSSDGGVALYSDGFYSSSVTNFARSNLFVERTEVLRGPQGTLYGRNAIGGAMNVISKRPSSDFEAEVRATLGNYDLQTYEAAVSGPIVGDLRGRLVGSYSDQGKGYFHNLSGGPDEGGKGESWDIQGQLEGQLADGKFEWWVKGERSKADTLGRGPGGRQGVSVGRMDTASVLTVGLTPSPLFGFNQPLPSSVCDRCFSTDTPNRIALDSETFVGTATLHLDGFDIKYIGGRTWYDYHLDNDVDGTARHEPFTVMPGQPGVIGGAAGTPSQIIPTGGVQVFPRQVNAYSEEVTWYSNELNIASTGGGPVQWLAGVYQFREDSTYVPVNLRFADDPRYETVRTPFGALAAPNPDRSYVVAGAATRSQSFAAFGQVNWDVAEQWRLTAGLRYTRDEKSADEFARLLCFTSPLPLCPAAVQRAYGVPVDATQFVVGAATFDGAGQPLDPSVKMQTLDASTGYRRRLLQNEWDAWGGTLGVDWKPDEDTLVYGKFTRGYKAGGFNSASPTLDPLVTTRKEIVDAYEIGAKRTLFGRRLQANASAFWYDYQDIQAVMSAFNDVTRSTQNFYANLPEATIKGLELEMTWQPIDDLQLLFNYAYLDAKIDEACCFLDPEDPLAQQPQARPRPSAPGSTPTAVLQDLSGQALGASTPNRVTVNANYTWRFAPGDLTGSVTYTWRDATYYSVFNRYYNRANAFEQVDARLLFNDAADRFTLIAYAKNIFDVMGQVGMRGTRLNNVGPNQGFVNQDIAYVPPRTYGIELQYRF